MITEQVRLEGSVVLQTSSFRDDRGMFSETFQDMRFMKVMRKDIKFEQDNVILSKKGVLRGMHCTLGKGSGKFVTCLDGCIFDVMVDLRRGSETFGRWSGIQMRPEAGMQVWVPPGCAHGFLSLTDSVVGYKLTKRYQMFNEGGLAWDDPDVGINWPEQPTLVSEKDRANAPLSHWR